MTDDRRYRSKASGHVYEVVVQSRSLTGSVTLRDPTDGVEIRTTNDRLAVDFEFFRVGERDDGEAHAAHLDEIVAQRNLAVAQAVAAEREACAKVLDDGSDEAHAAGTLAAQHGHHNDARAYDRLAAELDARASMIRARGKVPA